MKREGDAQIEVTINRWNRQAAELLVTEVGRLYVTDFAIVTERGKIGNGRQVLVLRIPLDPNVAKIKYKPVEELSARDPKECNHSANQMCTECVPF